MLDSIKIKLQYLLPKQCITRLIGWGADQQAGWMTHMAIKAFIRYYKINMKEALYSQPEHYKTFNDFFVRPLRNGMRPITDYVDGLVLPVDGTISQLGNIEQDKILQAKGYYYTLEALLAGNYLLAEEFKNGQFATIYLSPSNCHRVHMPCNGTLREMIYVPGDLFSVNSLMTMNVSNIFARNERLICIFDTYFGPIAQILIGATIVGSIETVWSGTVNSTREGIIQRWTYPATGEGAVILKKGEDMGRFKLGSTVINLFSANRIEFTPKLISGFKTIIGEEFAYKIKIVPD
ncbi:Phosphatidylserine decarboxylase proenzyme [Candidatus Profftia lariciata]|uniref:archaetidylserine decarboxylase n=1 Tax=Candidatus Profftia lariciata TaxID=1987921 RepID=UPI001D0172CF|nr:archaetidylserine decarboxylase [Candidatus Profftia lariciata]UDG81607.1 Phosphatidylserine decarboxylase proenzyme [Candidatus Profftia lariciata]